MVWDPLKHYPVWGLENTCNSLSYCLEEIKKSLFKSDQIHNFGLFWVQGEIRTDNRETFRIYGHSSVFQSKMVYALSAYLEDSTAIGEHNGFDYFLLTNKETGAFHHRLHKDGYLFDLIGRYEENVGENLDWDRQRCYPKSAWMMVLISTTESAEANLLWLKSQSCTLEHSILPVGMTKWGEVKDFIQLPIKPFVGMIPELPEMIRDIFERLDPIIDQAQANIRAGERNNDREIVNLITPLFVKLGIKVTIHWERSECYSDDGRIFPVDTTYPTGTLWIKTNLPVMPIGWNDSLWNRLKVWWGKHPLDDFCSSHLGYTHIDRDWGPNLFKIISHYPFVGKLVEKLNLHATSFGFSYKGVRAGINRENGCYTFEVGKLFNTR